MAASPGIALRGVIPVGLRHCQQRLLSAEILPTPCPQHHLPRSSIQQQSSCRRKNGYRVSWPSWPPTTTASSAPVLCSSAPAERHEAFASGEINALSTLRETARMCSVSHLIHASSTSPPRKLFSQFKRHMSHSLDSTSHGVLHAVLSPFERDKTNKAGKGNVSALQLTNIRGSSRQVTPSTV